MLNPKLLQFMIQLQNHDDNVMEKPNSKSSVKYLSLKKYGMFLPLKYAHVTIKSE